MKKSICLFFSVLCIVSVVVISCGMPPASEIESINENNGLDEAFSVWLDNNLLTKKEQLALLHEVQSHRSSEAEVLMSAQFYLEETNKAGNLRIKTDTREVILKDYERGFVTRNGEASASTVGLHLFTLESKDDKDESTGFMLLADDMRVGRVLAFVPKGDFNDTDSAFMNMFKYNLENYITETKP